MDMKDLDDSDNPVEPVRVTENIDDTLEKLQKETALISQKNKEKFAEIEARRGELWDKDGTPLQPTIIKPKEVGWSEWNKFIWDTDGEPTEKQIKELVEQRIQKDLKAKQEKAEYKT